MSPVTVETELASDDYARLRELAETEELAIEAALRQAVVEWPERPFAFHEGDEVPTAGRTDAGFIDRMPDGREDRS